ncbi:hypothetical protein V8C35DRAFT_308595, partial [Trichoderma chlorosporum]
MVTEGLQEVITNQAALNRSPLPQADSKQVEEWSRNISEAYSAVVRLDADSKNIAGARSV